MQTSIKKKLTYTLLTIAACSAALCVTTTSAKAQSFTEDQKKELEVLFKEFLANHPQEILDSVDNYREEQERKTQQSAEENLKGYMDFFKDNSLPMAGNPDGDVTVVEYFDYNCGYCHKAFDDIQKILEQDKNVRIIFQEMPILSPSSKLMSTYALAALKQDKYFEMHTALMDYRGSQSEQAYADLAQKIGLDMEKLKVDLKSPEIEAAISKAQEMARNLGIRGTPGFIIGEKIYPGYIGLQGMTAAINDAREAKKQ